MTRFRREYLHLAVTDRRRRLKERAIEYKGGKCARCGYDKKCPAVFDFHHLDPTKKDFAISGSCKSFERIRAELDKTVLLCANCHREVHEELATESLQLRREEFDRMERPKRGTNSHINAG